MRRRSKGTATEWEFRTDTEQRKRLQYNEDGRETTYERKWGNGNELNSDARTSEKEAIGTEETTKACKRKSNERWRGASLCQEHQAKLPSSGDRLIVFLKTLIPRHNSGSMFIVTRAENL
jgi:hypothetical protein